MGLPSYTAAAYTLIGMAERFQDFFNSDAKDVTFEYMDLNGTIQTKTVPNVAKQKIDLESVAPSNIEIDEILEPYAKIGVDIIVVDNDLTDTTGIKADALVINKNTGTIGITISDGQGGVVVNQITTGDETVTTVATPIITYSNSGLEGDTINGTIDNYDATATYNFVSNVGLISHSADSANFTVDLKAVDSDFSGQITVTASKDGEVTSSAFYMSITVVSNTPTTTTPSISLASSGNEGDVINGTITNFDSGATYSITSNVGTVTYTPGNSTFSVALLNVDADLNGSVTVTASKDGEITSASSINNVTVYNVEVTRTVDQVLSNGSFEENAESNDGFTY